MNRLAKRLLIININLDSFSSTRSLMIQQIYQTFPSPNIPAIYTVLYA